MGWIINLRTICCHWSSPYRWLKTLMSFNPLWQQQLVFVQLSQSPVSLCSLTAQKYTPLSLNSSLSTVRDPVWASFFAAGNLSGLNPLSYWWSLYAVVKTICFIPSSGSCLYQYISRYVSPFVWLQSIVALSPSSFHSMSVWWTSLPSVRPVWKKINNTWGEHINF